MKVIFLAYKDYLFLTFLCCFLPIIIEKDGLSCAEDGTCCKYPNGELACSENLKCLPG